MGGAARVVEPARAGRLGHELEVTGARLELNHRSGQVVQVERRAVGAVGVEIVERGLQPG